MKIVTADDAASLIPNGASILVSGSGGGHAIPEKVLEAIERRYLESGSPAGMTLIHVVGIGDRRTKGAARFRHPGMLKRSLTSALIDSPPLIELAQNDAIESYTLPQGALSLLLREIAAGRPGLVTRTGLHSFVDPRHGGGRQSPSANEDLVELLTLDGKEYLRFKPFAIDVAVLRGTTADEDGNVTMEHEAILGEMLSSAQAARRQGGIVIVQVKRLARRGTLPARAVKIPGILVDFVVVDPDQTQTYATEYSPAYAGEFRVPQTALKRVPFDVRKIVARRAAMEIFSGAICNLGSGISTGIAAVASEENILDRFVLTNEQGFIGGAPLTGVDSGAAQNYDAVVDQPYQFDFYDGGGLDIAFLSFAQVDARGNVNVSRFGTKIVGVGGFINISQNAKKVVFSGTFSSGGLEVETGRGTLRITREGAHRKFIGNVEQLCYNAEFAMEEGRKAVFVTERAVFETTAKGLRLIEIAPGIDMTKDILSSIPFPIEIAANPAVMDARLFRPEPVGLAERFR